MSLARITEDFFVTVINRLGLRPTFPDQWQYENIVRPVSLVDSDITLQAISSSQILGTPFTAGEVIAPAIGTRLAAMNPVTVAGNYSIFFLIGAGEGNLYRLRRRNNGDTADIWLQWISLLSNSDTSPFSMIITLEAGEFMVLENNNVGSAGAGYIVSIWVQGPL